MCQSLFVIGLNKCIMRIVAMLGCAFIAAVGLYECFRKGGDFFAGATLLCFAGISFLIIAKKQ